MAGVAMAGRGNQRGMTTAEYAVGTKVTERVTIHDIM